MSKSEIFMAAELTLCGLACTWVWWISSKRHVAKVIAQREAATIDMEWEMINDGIS